MSYGRYESTATSFIRTSYNIHSLTVVTSRRIAKLSKHRKLFRVWTLEYFSVSFRAGFKLADKPKFIKKWKTKAEMCGHKQILKIAKEWTAGDRHRFCADVSWVERVLNSRSLGQWWWRLIFGTESALMETNPKEPTSIFGIFILVWYYDTSACIVSLRALDFRRVSGPKKKAKRELFFKLKNVFNSSLDLALGDCEESACYANSRKSAFSSIFSFLILKDDARLPALCRFPVIKFATGPFYSLCSLLFLEAAGRFLDALRCTARCISRCSQILAFRI